MIKNYLKIAFRNLRKQKALSFINIAGLAVGMACFVIIFLYVRHELGFDEFNEKADRIYRIVAEHRWFDQLNKIAITPGPLAPAMVREFPEVIDATRFGSLYPALVRYGDKQFYEGGVYYADSSVFNIFTFPLLEGHSQNALARPFSAVVTKEIARKYFGEQEAIGKVLNIEQVGDFTVTAIMQDIPQDSHLQFNTLLSFATLEEVFPERVENWSDRSYFTYILLREDYPVESLEAKLPQLLKKYTEQAAGTDFLKLQLQPLQDIHLCSGFQFEIAITGDAKYLYVFSIVAIFILLIACINFMNISTARSFVRAKEVGVRKTLGGHRRQFFWQFLFESQLMSLLALLLAFALVELLLPIFNRMLTKNLNIDYLHNLSPILLAALGLSLLVGFVAGSYPAIFLSAFTPVDALKALSRTGASDFHRKGLVTFQFAISIALLFGTLVVSKQLHYMRNKNLGIASEQLVVISLMDSPIQSRTEPFKNALQQHPNVLFASASSTVPVRSKQQHLFRKEGADEKQRIWMNAYTVDPEFIETLGLDLIAGRNFSPGPAGETPPGTAEYIINRTAAKIFGWEDPIGKRIFRKNKLGTIIGVVEDFHIASLHHQIEPVVLYMEPGNKRYLLAKIAPENISGTLAFMREKWSDFDPSRPFVYSFLDAYFEQAYRNEEKLAQIFRAFSLQAIFIACLGLLGLAAYATERRTKEIGIRKVLGASVANVTALLSKDFVKLVLLANLIAWPVAWYAMNTWLQNFAYHIEISWWIFVLAGSLALVIAFITVSTQAIRAALANPVEALRYE